MLSRSFLRPLVKKTAYAYLFLVLFSLPAKAATDVQFIIDVSGSMTQKLGGEAQIDLARKALSSALGELKSEQLVAVRAYGHRVDQKNKEESCKDSELVVPFQPLNRSLIEQTIAKLTPKGYTPIAFSLQQTKNDLLDVGMARETERVIILLTDGEETCGGDPVAVMNQLKAEGFKVKVFSIGFNVNDIARKQLKDVADATGGKYFDAKDGAQLNSALKEASRAAAVIEKTEASYGEAIRGGDSYEQAVALPLGKELKLDHHQKSHAFDYSSVDLKQGNRITINCSTLLKGVAIQANGSAQSNFNPYCGLQLHSAERQKLIDVDALGQSKKASETYVVPTSGKYFVLAGSNYGAMPSDGAIFTVQVQAFGDLDTAQDAPDSMENALLLTPKRYSKNYICEGDKSDVFKFSAKAGDIFMLGLIPNSKDSGSVSLRIYNDFKQTVIDGHMYTNSGYKSEDIVIKEDGEYFLELECQSGKFFDYTLIWKQKNVADAEAAPSVPVAPVEEKTETAPAAM